MENNQQPDITALIEYLRLQTQPESISNEFLAGLLAEINEQKVDKENGKGLSTEDFTPEMKELINQDWIGTQQQYNALLEYNTNKWYFITLDDEVVAVYRGEVLVAAIPNMVGEFTADSSVDDWYWYPNGVKTPIPVDPATCKFSYYWPGNLNTAAKLFVGLDTPANDYVAADCRLKRLERMPTITGKVGQASIYYMLSLPVLLEEVPVIDCRQIQNLYYMCVQNNIPTQWERIAFKNTEQTESWEMTFNIHPQRKLKIVTGLDASSLKTALYTPLSQNNGAARVEITNLGKAPAAANLDLRDKHWGDDTQVRHARKSLVDSLLTNSFDRAAAGYSACTIQISPEAYARLTSDEVAAITAKGFTLVTA